MDKLLTTAQSAADLGVSLRTFGRLVNAGLIRPEMKLPGRTGARLFHRAEVERVKAERRATTAAA